MQGRPVVFRLFDFGSDKKPPSVIMPDEENPQLGWRGSRFLLDNPEVMRTQAKPADVAGDRDARRTRTRTSEGPAASKEASRFPGSLKLWSTGERTRKGTSLKYRRGSPAGESRPDVQADGRSRDPGVDARACAEG
jgi:hypothetical protein